MTDETPAETSSQTPLSDELVIQLRELKKAPLLDRGEAAVRLAAMMIVCIRDLETRIERLEASQ